MARSRKRYGRTDGLRSFVEPFLVYGALASMIFYTIMPYVYYAKNETLIVIGVFAAWRYGWLLLNFIRAFIYAKLVYPSLQKKIANLPYEKKYPKHIYFSIPSYKEEAWVSVETFKSIMLELDRIPSSATIIVSTSGDGQEDAVIYQTCKAYPAFEKVELVFQHQKEGKRIAMGHSMRAIARRYFKKDRDFNSVTFFMDGDSYLEKGFFEKLLPHFVIDREVGAVTTNEAAYINTKSNWYKDWFNLKFGQRHILFQSHSLSKKVLTLTGRLSAYRTDIIVEDGFIKRVENDIITTVMHGKFRFLMGDDKSTWFYLLKEGWGMRYLPDTLCYSLESRDANFLDLSKSLPYRWYGNTLRNSSRALALGPKRIKSFFIWWAILDQRISMWTSLVGITGAIILGITKAYFYFVFYVVWVLFVRLFQMFVIAYNGHPVSLRTLPLMLYTQWLGAFVKIKALFHLSDQKWSKGGETQSSDDSIAVIKHPLFRFMPDFMMVLSYTLFFYVLLIAHDAIAFPDIDILKNRPADKVEKKHLVIYAKDYGIVPNDGLDDAKVLNKLIQESADNSVIILPQGILDLYESVKIQRSNITIKGASKETTLIVSHLKTENKGAFLVSGKRAKKVGYLIASTKKGTNIVYMTCFAHKTLGRWVKLREPNDTMFFDMLGSKRWRKQYPYLRQEIVPVNKIQASLLFLGNRLSTNFEKSKTEVWNVDMVENVVLQDFTIRHLVQGHTIQEVEGVYENRFPNERVDMIRFDYAAYSQIHNVKIVNAGSHAFVFENVYGCRADHLDINGAWNKGKGGNGYVRFARAFHSTFEYSKVKNIRHITLQWSSSDNVLSHLDLGVDINLHGGYSHDNSIRDITFHIPKYHKWKGISTTPKDAKWAPPDGENNVVSKVSYR